MRTESSDNAWLNVRVVPTDDRKAWVVKAPILAGSSLVRTVFGPTDIWSASQEARRIEAELLADHAAMQDEDDYGRFGSAWFDPGA